MNTLTIEEIKSIIKDKIFDLVVPKHTVDGHFYGYIPTNETYASVTTKSGILEAPHLKKWAANLAVQYIDKNWNIITPQNKQEIYEAAVLDHVNNFRDAGDIGTQGHEIVDEYLKLWMEGDKPEDIRRLIKGEDIRLWAITRSAEMFCKDFNVVPVASELLVANSQYKYAGTLDTLMMIPRVIREGDPNCGESDIIKPITLGHQTITSLKNSNIEYCFNCDRKVIHELTLVDWKTSNNITQKPEYLMQTAAYYKALQQMTGIRCKRILIVRLDKAKAGYEVIQVLDINKAFKAFLNISKVYDWLMNAQPKSSEYPELKLIDINNL